MVVVGRCRPDADASCPINALTSVLLPVPVPPNVATTNGDSRRIRREFTRSRIFKTSDRAFRPGAHAGASLSHRRKRSTRSSISAKIVSCCSSGVSDMFWAFARINKILRAVGHAILVCHWLCQCVPSHSQRLPSRRESTGGASGTRKYLASRRVSHYSSSTDDGHECPSYIRTTYNNPSSFVTHFCTSINASDFVKPAAAFNSSGNAPSNSV